MRIWKTISFFAFPLITAQPSLQSQAKERVKLEVVSASTFTYMDMGTRLVPATPQQTTTTCRGTSGIYNPSYGSSCVSTTNPATPVHAVIWPTALGAYDGVAVILPTGEHLILTCDADHDKRCGKFLNDSTAGLDKSCSDPVGIADTNFRYLCIYTMRGYSTLGKFDAVIDGDKITISGPEGKRTYRKYGVWGEAGAPTAGVNKATPGSMNEPSGGNAMTASQRSAIDPEELRMANTGDANAEFIAGTDYFTQANYTQAAALFRKAADQGFSDAQFSLGMLYFNGEGVPQSYAEAYFWYDLAAALTNGPNLIRFSKERDNAAARLSSAERNDVQQRAVRWFSEHGSQAANP